MGVGYIVVDTNVLADRVLSRIIEQSENRRGCPINFFKELFDDKSIEAVKIIVPRIVIFEVKTLIDSRDRWRRLRGKHALEELNWLKKHEMLEIEWSIIPWNVNNPMRDEIIVECLRKKGEHGLLLTNDRNLKLEADILGLRSLLAREIVPPLEKEILELIRNREGYIDAQELNQIMKKRGVSEKFLEKIVETLIKRGDMIALKDAEKRRKIYCRSKRCHLLFDTYSLREGRLFSNITNGLKANELTYEALKTISKRFQGKISRKENYLLSFRLVIPTSLELWLSFRNERDALRDLKELESYPHIRKEKLEDAISPLEIKDLDEREINILILTFSLKNERYLENLIVGISHPDLRNFAETLGFDAKQIFSLV